MQAGWTILALSVFSGRKRWPRCPRIPNAVVIFFAALVTWLVLIVITQLAIFAVA